MTAADDVARIQRIARALHAKAELLGTPVPLDVVELIVCDTYLILVDGMTIEAWETPQA